MGQSRGRRRSAMGCATQGGPEEIVCNSAQGLGAVVSERGGLLLSGGERASMSRARNATSIRPSRTRRSEQRHRCRDRASSLRLC